MTVIAVGSVKSSPGVTAATLALAATWPAGPRIVVVEADPAGGDVTARFGLHTTPGLVSLAAATRRERPFDVLWRHTQHLPGGLPVVVGPAGADQARAALAVLAPPGGRLFTELSETNGTLALLDCGRLDPDTPAIALVRTAQSTLLVVRPRLNELSHVAARARWLRSLGGTVGLVLVDDGPYPLREVAEAIPLPILGVLAHDARGAAALEHPDGARGLRRALLLRSAAPLAARLAVGVGTHPGLVDGGAGPLPLDIERGGWTDDRRSVVSRREALP